MRSKKIVYQEREYIVFENGRIVGPKGRDLTWFYNNDGYPYVCTKHGAAYVHRLVALAFVPNPNGYKEVDHKDGNRANPNAYNLEWVSHSENVRRAAEKGAYRGEKNGSAKLNRYDVMGIKALDSLGLSSYKIAKLYPVSREQIRSIINGKKWKHISIITE